MEGDKDVLLQYFSEQYEQKCLKYAKRVPPQQFSAQQPKDLKCQFQFLNQSDPTGQKTQTSFMPTIIQIRGDRMRSVIDNQVYGIFCQAPSKWSTGHFWSTCYREKVSKIFMLTNSYEYWPKSHQQLKFEQQDLTIRCLWEEPVNPVLIRRPIIITGPQGERKLEHLHFIKWRDGGIPEGEASEEAFRIMVEQAIRHIDNKQMIVAHCLAGVGRTGTLGAVIEGVRCRRKFQALSMFEIVKNMRWNREYCVEWFEQYCFAHRQAQLIS